MVRHAARTRKKLLGGRYIVRHANKRNPPPPLFLFLSLVLNRRDSLRWSANGQGRPSNLVDREVGLAQLWPSVCGVFSFKVRSLNSPNNRGCVRTVPPGAKLLPSWRTCFFCERAVF